VVEMVTPGQTGSLLPETSSPRALGELLLAYLRDPGRVSREGARAREAVEARFDARAHGRAIEVQLREVLEG
jgi:glycosyltransferase involved in cell wall biosynthesis